MGAIQLLPPQPFAFRIDRFLSGCGYRVGYAVEGWHEPCGERVLCLESRRAGRSRAQRIRRRRGRIKDRRFAGESSRHAESRGSAGDRTWHERYRATLPNAKHEDAYSPARRVSLVPFLQRREPDWRCFASSESGRVRDRDDELVEREEEGAGKWGLTPRGKRESSLLVPSLSA